MLTGSNQKILLNWNEYSQYHLYKVKDYLSEYSLDIIGHE